MDQIESGEHQVDSELDCCSGEALARIQWLPEADWLVVRMEDAEERKSADPDAATKHTVQGLLQEREITYRNLLAAYLRLQEVNRQKTVFLASAAHELKTPLAVIKGYYDLLLSGSLGKLTDKQRDILQESKESCERLVRLVSMFLNYSALESGKLVLHLRENDLRDCLGELATRWHETFVRKHVRLDTTLNSDLPIFKFDYQKVQQTVANLLDNALKHTPAGGQVDTVAPNSISGNDARRKKLSLSTAAASVCSLPTASKFPYRIPARESPPSIIRKYSRISFAWTEHPRAWAWAWRLPSVWCRRIAARSGWIANRDGAVRSHSFCR